MPSSRARRRRAQQRRGGPGSQGPQRRAATSSRPPLPASVEEAESLEPVREQAEAEPIDGVEAEEAVDTAGVDESEPDLEDEDEPELEYEDADDDGTDETLEEQEADIERAEAELEEQRAEPVARGRRTRAAASATTPEPGRPVTRSSGRNRRRGATPQPQGPAVARFFRETFDELRKVDWPTPSELYRYTIIVIITVIVLAAFIAGIDWVLQQLAEKFIYGSSGAAG